jgi:hypothetical protein
MGDSTMHAARRLALSVSLMSFLACPMSSHIASAQDRPKPLVIPLQPFGLPKGFFSGGRSLTCFHAHKSGTRLFWLDNSHIFVAFTTNSPCTFKSGSDTASVRAVIFERTGAKVASRDWPLEGDFTLFAGPNHLVVLWRGNKLEFLDDHLQPVDSGELAEKPKGLYVTPARHTIPLLSADGHNFEFYSASPLKLLTTIPIDQSTEINAVEDWTPGDERVAGVHCQDKSDYSCTKILVLTPDANFLRPDGEPWSYEETAKPVALHPIGFLDPTHLLVSRLEKGFLRSPQVLIIRSDGSKTLLPNPGASFFVHDIAGITADGTRFGLEYTAASMCENCVSERRFVVEELDSKRFLFEKYGSPFFSRFELSPDGKSVAVLDDGALSIYPLPAHE